MKSTDQQTVETKAETSEVAHDGATQGSALAGHTRSPVRMKIKTNIKAGTTFGCTACGVGGSNHNQSTARAQRIR